MTSKKKALKFTPGDLAQAHQFLYYCFPDYVIWSDYDYDRYCLYHGINGGGGSDNPMDYSGIVKELAWHVHANRGLYQGVFDEIPDNISDIVAQKLTDAGLLPLQTKEDFQKIWEESNDDTSSLELKRYKTPNKITM